MTKKKLKTSPAQQRARDKWNANNKEKRKIYIAKSTAKRYIRDLVLNMDELSEVKSWVEEKEKNLKKDL